MNKANQGLSYFACKTSCLTEGCEMRKNQDLHSNYFPYFLSSYATPMLNKGPEVLNMKILLFSFNYLQLLNIYTSTWPMVVSREPQR